MKKMPVEEFVRLGILQEVNRQFLHPMGLALEVIELSDGSCHFSSIWDCRDDPEGIIFKDIPHPEAEDYVKQLRASHRNMRRKILMGKEIQPIKKAKWSAKEIHDFVKKEDK